MTLNRTKLESQKAMIDSTKMFDISWNKEY